MPYKKNKLPAGIILLVPFLFLTNCARVPWTSLIEGDQKSAIEQTYLNSVEKTKRCSSSWDGEVTVSWDSAVQTYSFSAYCQVLEPSYIKLIVSNPLGQPLKLISTNGTDYQAIDAHKRSSVGGSLRAWAIRNEIPLTLTKMPWLDWLQGRANPDNNQILEIREDAQNRGVWLGVAETDMARIQEHVLFDIDTSLIFQRLIVDEQNKPLATITYGEWQQFDGCRYPAQISFTGLPYGSSAELIFSDVKSVTLTRDSFNLKIPPGFTRKLLP